MTIIKPFKGILYNKKTVGDISRVITPPYDVITPRKQAGYYKSHPNNFIRIDLGKKSEKDTAADNRYTRAKRYFEDWIRKGALIRDDAPSIYIYSQEYTHEGKKASRMGFISLAKLEEDRTKGFLPHERTFSGPKLDRFRLTEQVRANLSPIFSIVFDDRKKIIGILNDFAGNNRPIIDVKFEGTRNKLWRLSDRRMIKRLCKALRTKQALIADGHHRYEVSLEFRQAALKSKKALPESYNYVMMYFAPSDERGLTILPTHRMVRGVSAENFRKNLKKISKFFDIIVLQNRAEMFSRMRSNRKHLLGVYLGRKDYFCLVLKQKNAHNLITSQNSSYWRDLDVVILHKLVFEKIFGLKGKAAEKSIFFTRDPQEAFDWAKAGKNKAAFFLNPPTLKDIKNIARCRERMPHKTTYFFPKPLSGLVVNKLD